MLGNHMILGDTASLNRCLMLLVDCGGNLFFYPTHSWLEGSPLSSIPLAYLLENE